MVLDFLMPIAFIWMPQLYIWMLGIFCRSAQLKTYNGEFGPQSGTKITFAYLGAASIKLCPRN
ncbi:hypothetical protein CP500_016790 [Tychonema bourrellyi FEM_GT703]|uniref:Uncharacterized protein n=1 Tax=Tychonema bourrellyi FEM_GT703 TaxID=2040638 RepID=A0A2G4EXT3_9CYAN|nr:hypothetical protein CP500_016790 [Tychonema bourrellyi FEM_GT703]